MKMIKPIVNISKILDNFDTILIGLDGVITDGHDVKSETITTLVNMKKQGKRIVLVTNSPHRVLSIAKFLHQNSVPLAVFDSIVSAGEILHYKLKNREDEFASVGTAYYKIGDASDMGAFSWLDYQPVDNLARADFIYMSKVVQPEDRIENYLPILEHAASMGIPFVCAGNDTSTFLDGKICLAPGAVAEQYAVLGGRIVTVGKPDIDIFEYCLDGLEDVSKDKVLLIGDNMQTEIKGANLFGISCALVSKGVHVNYLGEGYIPDVAKTRELAINFDAYPDFVISNLRW